MRDSKSSRKKPIKEVQELRARKPKLERASSDIAERKKAEEKLRQSEQRFRSIFDNANDIIGFVNTAGKIIEVNKKVADILGYEPDELVGKNFMKCGILQIKNAPTIIRLFKELVKRRELPDIEGDGRNVTQLALRHKKGHTVFIEASTTAIKTDGKLEGFLSVIRDITERKRAEEALRESQQQKQAILDSIPDIAWLKDKEGRYLAANEPLCKAFGVKLEDLVGKTDFDISPEELAKRYRTDDEKVMKSGEHKRVEEPWGKKKGKRIWIETIKTPIYNDKGEIVGTSGLARDITDRKKAEEALRLERDNFTNILDSMEDGVYIVDQNYDFQYVNPALKKDFGPCEGRKCYEYFHDRNQDCPWCTNREVFAGKTVRWEWYSARNQKTYDLVDTPLRNPDGTISKLEIFRDITDRKQAEEALRESEETALAILNATYDLAFLIDTEGTMLALNETFAKRFGKRVDELVGSCVFDLLPPDVAAKRKAQGNKVIRSGQPLRFEDVRQGRHLDSGVYPVFDANGKVERLAVFSSDITERKQAEEALKESEERLRSLLETMTEGVVLIASDGQIVYANPASECIAGLKRSEIEGNSYDSPKWDMLRPDGTPMPPEEWAGPHAMKEKRPVKDMVMGVRRPDGSICWINLDATPIMNDAGEVDGIVLTFADITERKKAEESLRASEIKFRGFVENLDGIAVRGGMESKPEFLIGKLKDITGYTWEDFSKKGLKWLDIMHPDDKKELVEKGLKDVVSRKPINQEYRIVRKDGSIRWVSQRISPQMKEDDTPEFLQGVIVDITERKQAEEALRESEEKLRTLVERANDGICILQDGLLKYANPRTAEITGYTVEEMTNTPFARYVHPDELPKVADVYERRMAGEEIGSTYETVVRRKDGSNVYIEVNGGLITYEGKPANLAFARDITERKQAEDALQESEERFRTLFESAPDGIYLNDLEGNFVDGNKAAEELVGFKREELIGKNLVEAGLLPAGETPKALANLEKVANGEPTGPEEFTLERRDGSSINVEIRAFPVRIRDQILSLGIARDITERKNAERRLLREQAKLKSLASQLTLAEEHERRRIATDLHDRISQSLVISKMNLEALRKSGQSERSARTLDEVCNLLGQAITDTRTLTFDLSSPILHQLGFEAAVAEWLTEQIQDEHGIATRFEDDDRPKPLDDDISVLLFRNVRELLINVVKHAHAHKVKVAIRKVGKKIQVSVEDDGVGFDPAEAASSASKRAEFGLFSIRQRLEQLGGHLEINSEPGRGCKVTMTAPLKQE